MISSNELVNSRYDIFEIQISLKYAGPNSSLFIMIILHVLFSNDHSTI